MAAVDLQGLREPSRAAREIEKARGLAMPLHELDALEGFERTDQDGRGHTLGFADNVQHEVRAVVEENVDVAGRQMHGTDTRSRAAKMMPCGIARRISLGFHNAAAYAASGQVVDHHFANQETRELDGTGRKFRAEQPANGNCRRGFLDGDKRRGHGGNSARHDSL